MIGHEDFAQMRLSRFVPESDIEELDDWEFMNEVWIGEAVGFSEWLRRKDDPRRLGSLSLDLRTFPATRAVMRHLRLPLRLGKPLSELMGLFGEPEACQEWAADRRSYEFSYPKDQPYKISCTITDGEGLHYVVIMTGRPAM